MNNFMHPWYLCLKLTVYADGNLWHKLYIGLLWYDSNNPRFCARHHGRVLLGVAQPPGVVPWVAAGTISLRTVQAAWSGTTFQTAHSTARGSEAARGVVGFGWGGAEGGRRAGLYWPQHGTRDGGILKQEC